MNLAKLTVPLLCLLLWGCSSSIPPEYGMVDWSLSNGSGSRVTVVVYDKICKRTYLRIQLRRSGQRNMSTCANSEGIAEIRYRNSSYNQAEFPWADARMNHNQTLVIYFWPVVPDVLAILQAALIIVLFRESLERPMGLRQQYDFAAGELVVQCITVRVQVEPQIAQAEHEKCWPGSQKA